MIFCYTISKGCIKVRLGQYLIVAKRWRYLSFSERYGYGHKHAFLLGDFYLGFERDRLPKFKNDGDLKEFPMEKVEFKR